MSEDILLLDTSISTRNTGDLVIMDSVISALEGLFPKARFFNAPTHDVIGKVAYALNKECEFTFVGGTNLLSSNMNVYNQWRVNYFDAMFIRRGVILMGVGWWQYQKGVNYYTKSLYKRILNREYQHSVRDSYSKIKLAEAGFENCINTGCPTTWRLTPEHCLSIPFSKSDRVVFTLTDYNRDAKSDVAMVRSLREAYDKVYFWPQGSRDLDYLRSLSCEVEVIAPSLKSFDSILAGSEPVDYVGTRLHAGIRALQHKRRSIIIGVDNRAAEMAKDIDLPFVPRGEIDGLNAMIDGEWLTDLSIDFDSVEAWTSQFTS